MLVVILSALLLYALFFKNASSTANTATEAINKENAQSIAVEKNKDTAVVTTETVPVSVEPTIVQPTQSTTPQATVDDYGPSTKLDRPNVHAVVLAVYSIYADFLFKLQSVPVQDRQGVADQYVSDNSAYFGSSFNYLGSDSLHLFPQAADLDLPSSIQVHSAIIDLSDPTQVIVQIIMKPDTSWSILANVKMKDSLGNFGTFEKLTPRMNIYPL